MWQAVVAAQVVQCLSIVTACVPYLKPFLDSLESGQMRADDLRRRGKTGVSGYGGSGGSGSNQRSGGTAGAKPAIVDLTASASSQQSELHKLENIPEDKRCVITATATGPKEPASSWDEQSQTSQTVLIKQTRTWDVDVERRGAVNRGG